jgi:hypothetical protein
MTFRVNAKHFSITWPQYSCEKQELWEFINSKYKIKRSIICEEFHQDNHFHMHMYAEFEKKINITNDKVFDYPGHGVNKNGHPNIQATSNITGWIIYLRKSDPKTHEFNMNTEVSRTKAPVIENLYNLARETHDEELFYTECRISKINFMYAQHAWTKVIKQASIHQITKDTIIGGEIKAEILIGWSPPDPRISVWIKGPTGCGKTTWAKQYCNKPALFVTNTDSLRQFIPGYHVSIIFDDMDFSHLPLSTQIYIVDVDDDRQIHARYQNSQIPKGVQKIFLSNEEIFSDYDPILRRLQKLTIPIPTILVGTTPKKNYHLIN